MWCSRFTFPCHQGKLVSFLESKNKLALCMIDLEVLSFALDGNPFDQQLLKKLVLLGQLWQCLIQILRSQGLGMIEECGDRNLIWWQCSRQISLRVRLGERTYLSHVGTLAASLSWDPKLWRCQRRHMQECDQHLDSMPLLWLRPPCYH